MTICTHDVMACSNDEKKRVKIGGAVMTHTVLWRWIWSCRKFTLFLFVGLGCPAIDAGIRISDVESVSAYPWDKVTIAYTITGQDSRAKGLKITASDRGNSKTYRVLSVSQPPLNQGRHCVVWDAAKDGVRISSSRIVFTIDVVTVLPWMVVDISGGSNASSYGVVYQNSEPSGGWINSTYLKNRIVFRCIEAGTYTMGSPSSELGRSSDETQHSVTITQPFYMAITPLTRIQYKNITGSDLSGQYLTGPALGISYKAIRGANKGILWPSDKTVDETSVAGLLRAKTGLLFDLPTEAQWEFACRAGTTTALNSGKNLSSTGTDANMAEVGKYAGNSYGVWVDGKFVTGQYAECGQYLPNPFGIYDMHGNVKEWCLDWYQSNLGTSAVIDPVGASSGAYRVVRGGNTKSNASACRSASRDKVSPSSANVLDFIGFRFACPVDVDEMVLSTASTEEVSINTTFVSGTSVSGGLNIQYHKCKFTEETSVCDGTTLILSATNNGSFAWQAQNAGNKLMIWNTGMSTITTSVNIATLAFQPEIRLTVTMRAAA